MADIYSLTIRADTRDVTRARQALAGLSDGSIKARRATQQLQVATQQSVRRGFTPMRGAVQQAGFQIGDFAVQVGAGQNALVAFAQQGSQLAGIFGPGGAVIGAIIAIGGAIAGGFARSMGEGGESVEELAEKTKELTEELGRATDAQARFVRGQFAQQAAGQRDIIKEQQEELEFLNVRMERFIETNRRVGVPLDAIKENGAYLSLAEQAEEAQVRIDNANAALEAGDLSLREYEDAIKGVGDESQTAAERLDSMIESLQAQADTLGLSARETALYEAARLGANAADIEAINNSFDIIESYRRQQQAQKALMESTKIGVKDDPLLQRIEAQRRGMAIMEEESKIWAEKIADNQQQVTSTMVGTVGAALGTLQQFTEEGSAEYAALVLAQKAIMASQAIMAGNLAAAMALTTIIPGDPTSPARAIAQAEVMRTLGYVNAGLIMAQGVAEVAGARMHGGSVSAGGRYLVGENGPEIVTMGGSGVVTPSSVTNRGGDTNITQVLQVPGNIQQEVKQQIMAAMPLIRNTAINAVSTEINRGGNMARQVGRRS